MKGILTEELFNKAKKENPEMDTRNIYILDVVNKNKKMQIIGIDIYTAQVVIIVDHNNKTLGLHKYDEKLKKLVDYVIKARFELYSDGFINNALVIKSDYEVLGKSNLNNLIEKYYACFDNTPLLKFDEVIKLSYDKSFAQIVVLTKFTGSELKKYNDSYQLKMNDKFVNLKSRQENLSDNEGKFFSGLALITWKKVANGNIKYFCDNLYGTFSSKLKRTHIPLEKRDLSQYKEKMENMYCYIAVKTEEVLLENEKIQEEMAEELYEMHCIEENKYKQNYLRAWNRVFENDDGILGG